MLRSILRRDGNSSSNSLSSLAQVARLQSAMRGVSFVMDDDFEKAELSLDEDNSSFHKLGRGILAFFRATLGFEQEMIKAASECLADAEHSAYADLRRAQRDPHVSRSEIYAPGAEYALCQAEAQLMAAVVGVLNESLTESIRGFYKLRKAYVALNEILTAESDFVRRKRRKDAKCLGKSARDSKFGSEFSLDGNVTNQRAENPRSVFGADTHHKSRSGEQHDSDKSDDDEFYDAEDSFDNLSQDAEDWDTEAHSSLYEDKLQYQSNDEHNPRAHDILEHDPESEIFASPIDVFIHSGANLCFGLLLVMLSMIPPAFAKLLYIIGFKGDKERGMKMLWQASKFDNVNGAFAGLVVLGIYNTINGLADIVPESEPSEGVEVPVDAYSKERCKALLNIMRTRYPKSRLWQLEQARMAAFDKDIPTAISILQNSEKSSLKQLEAIEYFELSLDAMYSHQFALCSNSFVKCVSLNNWSHALFYYIAGAAELELYRQTKQAEPMQAKKHEGKLIELFHLVPVNAGKKKLMARQLPFDAFVTRKIKKWESRAKEWNCSFADAIGVSPLEEMIFFWNGYKRQGKILQEESLQRLAWSLSNPHWSQEDEDEPALFAVLQAATLRHLGRYEEAKAILQSNVLEVDRGELRGGLRDDWTAPAAFHEMAAIAWTERSDAAHSGANLAEQERFVLECEKWVNKAANSESYQLDARIGIKISTAQDTLRRWRAQRGLPKL